MKNRKLNKENYQFALDLVFLVIITILSIITAIIIVSL